MHLALLQLLQPPVTSRQLLLAARQLLLQRRQSGGELPQRLAPARAAIHSPPRLLGCELQQVGDRLAQGQLLGLRGSRRVVTRPALPAPRFDLLGQLALQLGPRGPHRGLAPRAHVDQPAAGARQPSPQRAVDHQRCHPVDPQDVRAHRQLDLAASFHLGSILEHRDPTDSGLDALDFPLRHQALLPPPTISLPAGSAIV
jgi:hypothetical protein